MKSSKRTPAASLLPLAFGLLVHVPSHAQNVGIQFNLSSPNVYDYTVSNVSLSPPLKDFVIWFPDESGPGDYQNLTVLSSPAGWTGNPAEPTAISLNGYVEWYTAGSGITAGQSLGGFSVTFTNLGTGTPGSQFFRVYDDSFNEVSSGWTTAVPEPAETAMAGLLGVGLWVAGARAYRARKHSHAGR